MAKGFFSDEELVSSGGDTIADVLTDWGNEVIEKLKKSLADSTSEMTSGNLSTSLIVLPIEFLGNKWQLTFKAADYWKFINEGVQGAGGKRKTPGKSFVNKAPGSPFKFTSKPPPLFKNPSLRYWAENKGLNPFAVRASIFRQGIRATHFFDKVITDTLKRDLISRLEKAGAREIELTLTKDFK